MCKVTWCTNEVQEQAHWATRYCEIHSQYKIYGRNAPSRPWLFYKIERLLAGKHQCECCGYDPTQFFPERPLNQISGLFDVDHIDSTKKHTLEGEQPSNYQLVCKHCHILKSYDENDYTRKDYR